MDNFQICVMICFIVIFIWLIILTVLGPLFMSSLQNEINNLNQCSKTNCSICHSICRECTTDTKCNKHSQTSCDHEWTHNTETD